MILIDRWPQANEVIEPHHVRQAADAILDRLPLEVPMHKPFQCYDPVHHFYIDLFIVYRDVPFEHIADGDGDLFICSHTRNI